MRKQKSLVGATLLTSKHHSKMKNFYNLPLLGWKKIFGIPRSYINTKNGFAMVWMLVQRLNEGILKPLYEQFQVVENPGVIVIVKAGDRFGLVENHRNVGPRLKVKNPNYVLGLSEENRWEELAASLGQKRIETVAGIAPAIKTTGNSKKSLSQLVLAAAKAEALEEGGFTLGKIEEVGMLNMNPTFFVHAQHVVLAEVTGIGEQQPEDLEVIGTSKLYSVHEIRDLINLGLLDDAKTLGAFALAGIHIPL